jgi:hypothetical protein
MPDAPSDAQSDAPDMPAELPAAPRDRFYLRLMRPALSCKVGGEFYAKRASDAMRGDEYKSGDKMTKSERRIPPPRQIV